MFSGSSSPPKEKADSIPPDQTPPLTLNTAEATVSQKKFSPPTPSFFSRRDKDEQTASSGDKKLSPPTPSFFSRRTNDDQTAGSGEKKFSPPTSSFFSRRNNDDQTAGSGEKRRRSSTVTKAATFFSNAKNSLSLSHSRETPNNGTQFPSNPLQKLGRMDPALSVPQGSYNNSAGESIPTSRSSFRVGVTEDRNRKCRRTMEDTHAYLYNFLGTPAPSTESEVNGIAPSTTSASSEDLQNVVETDNGYFAIFDGHAGTFAAEWCGKKLHLILEEIMRKNPDSSVPELLDQTFTSVDQQLEKLPLKNSGCTAVIALLRWEDRVPNSQSATGSTALAPAAAAASNEEETAETPTQSVPPTGPPAPASVLPKLQEKAVRQRVLYTANVGDARIVLCRNGKALRLSYDHKGSDENEGKRIANAGGLILNNRVNGVLAVTRALGDAYLKDLVTGHPYTTETVIQPDSDEFIILACDGLWDVCSDQEAVELVRNIPDAQEASKVLVDHALSRFSTDNLSCMVIRFDSTRVKEIASHATEHIGVDGDPTNTERGVSETDRIVEGARRSMASAGLADDNETAEKVNEEILQKMSNDEPGPELSVNEHTDLPQVVEETDAETKDDAKPEGTGS